MNINIVNFLFTNFLSYFSSIKRSPRWDDALCIWPHIDSSVWGSSLSPLQGQSFGYCSTHLPLPLYFSFPPPCPFLCPSILPLPAFSITRANHFDYAKQRGSTCNWKELMLWLWSPRKRKVWFYLSQHISFPNTRPQWKTLKPKS